MAFQFTNSVENNQSPGTSSITKIVLQPVPKSAYASNSTIIKKFPLLSQNFVINEDMETKVRSPLEVFTFPAPPVSRPPSDKSSFNHYSIKTASGNFDEYASVQNATETPKSIFKSPKLKPKNILEANYDPFSGNYSAISHSRYHSSLNNYLSILESIFINHPSILFSIVNMESMTCARCDNGFEPKAKIVNSNGELYHPECFV